MTTEVMQAAQILESKGYVIGHIYDGPAHSFVAFLDPYTLSKDWSGKHPFGMVKFLASEIRELRGTPYVKGAVYARVKEAEDALLREIGPKHSTEAIKSLAVNLSLTLLAVYPSVKLFTM